MKIALWFYWLAVVVVCIPAWISLPHFGSFLHDALGGKPFPGVTQLALNYRNLLLAPPLVFAGAVIRLSRSLVQPSAATLFAAASVLTITSIVCLLLLAVILPLTMGGPIEGGTTPSMWRWLFTGTW